MSQSAECNAGQSEHPWSCTTIIEQLLDTSEIGKANILALLQNIFRLMIDFDILTIFFENYFFDDNIIISKAEGTIF